MVTTRRGYVQTGTPQHQHVRRYLHPKSRGTNSNPAGPPSGLAVAGDISKVERSSDQAIERSSDPLMGWWGIAKRIEYI